MILMIKGLLLNSCRVRSYAAESAWKAGFCGQNIENAWLMASPETFEGKFTPVFRPENASVSIVLNRTVEFGNYALWDVVCIVVVRCNFRGWGLTGLSGFEVVEKLGGSERAAVLKRLSHRTLGLA
jgi:hypothetical protein